MEHVFAAADHTFVICAYGKSPYLKECIESLMAQSVKGRIIMVTSTPSDFLSSLSEEYNIPLYVNEGEKGIAGDWNFGLSQVKTKLATIAHQDDIYCPDYGRYIIEAADRAFGRDPIIIFSDYGELRDGIRTDSNKLLKIKRIMLFPLRSRGLAGSKWIRRRVISLGNPISCPAVTYVMDRIEQPLFIPGQRSNIDWQAWEQLSRLKGSFVFVPKILMYHRIHEESTTSELIADTGRAGEDLAMYRLFWPEWIAKRLVKVYSSAEKSNELDSSEE